MDQALKVFISICLYLAAAGAYAVEAPPLEADEFHFVILGDAQFHQPAKFNRVIDQARRLRPAFVMQVGDLIEGYNSDLEVIEEEWSRFKKQVGPLDPVPFYAVPGNHDVFNGEREVDPRLEDIYSKHWGPLYYSFVYKNTLFIILNTDSTEASNNIVGEQLIWLKKVLKDSDAEHKFVFMHRPPLLLKDGERLHQLFVDNGVERAFYGHHHHYHHFVRDGVAYTMTNAAANSVNDTEAVGGFHQLLQVSIRGAEVDVAVIKADAIKPEDAVAPIDNYDFFALSQRLAPGSVNMKEINEGVYELVIPLHNNSARDIQVLASCTSEDLRWDFAPRVIAPVQMPSKSNSEIKLSVGYEKARVPESSPTCRLQVPFQTLRGEWIEYSQEVLGKR